MYLYNYIKKMEDKTIKFHSTNVHIMSSLSFGIVVRMLNNFDVQGSNIGCDKPVFNIETPYDGPGLEIVEMDIKSYYTTTSLGT